MNLVERAKNIILKPKEEWTVIDRENTSVITLTILYLIPFTLLLALAFFIKYGIFGISAAGAFINMGFKWAIIYFISSAVSIFISTLIINYISPNFGTLKNFSKIFNLFVYSLTPVFICSVFQIIPFIGFLSILGLYGLYVLYIGIKPMMKTPDDKVTTYFVVSLLVIIAVYFIISAILAFIIIGKTYSMPVMQ